MMHTSVPLKLLASSWLDETAELPVPPSNKVFHDGLKVSEDKKSQWLDRVDGKFKAKAGLHQFVALSPQLSSLPPGRSR